MWYTIPRNAGPYAHNNYDDDVIICTGVVVSTSCVYPIHARHVLTTTPGIGYHEMVPDGGMKGHNDYVIICAGVVVSTTCAYPIHTRDVVTTHYLMVPDTK